MEVSKKEQLLNELMDERYDGEFRRAEIVMLKHQLNENKEKIEDLKSYRIISKVLARHKQKTMKKTLARKEEIYRQWEIMCELEMPYVK